MGLTQLALVARLTHQDQETHWGDQTDQSDQTHWGDQPHDYNLQRTQDGL